MSQLWSKHVPVIDICPACQLANETIHHALVSCTFAQQCWRAAFPNIILDGSTDFPSWLHHNLQATSKDTHAELAIICWAIWKARNNLVWNQQRSHFDSVVYLAKQHLKLWIHAQSWSSTALFQYSLKGDGADQWVKP